MTPLVREMSALVPEPESAHWFDLGTVPQHLPAQSMEWEIARHLPYQRTVAVFRTDAGARYACWLQAGDSSVTLAYVGLESGKPALFSHPTAFFERDGAIAYHSRAGDEASAKHAARMLVTIAKRLYTERTSYRPERAGTIAQQRKRERHGKRPLFVWNTVEISPQLPESSPALGGTHASPRAHDRRGHWRNHSTKGRVWVKACRVGSASNGVVFKDYEVTTWKART